MFASDVIRGESGFRRPFRLRLELLSDRCAYVAIDLCAGMVVVGRSGGAASQPGCEKEHENSRVAHHQGSI